MKLFSSKKSRSVWVTSVAGICQNLSAAWFGLILVSPGLALFEKKEWFSILTKGIFFGILFLYLSVLLTKHSK